MATMNNLIAKTIKEALASIGLDITNMKIATRSYSVFEKPGFVIQVYAKIIKSNNKAGG